MAARRPLNYPRFRAFNGNGVPLEGGTVEFFEAGSTNNRTVYSDPDLTVAAPNPVTLNARGEPESGGGTPIDIYLDGEPYKIVLKDSDGNTVWTIDDYIVGDLLTGTGDAEVPTNSDIFADTLSDLQGKDTSGYSTTDTLYLRGRASVGDGGEGHFRWDSSDLSTEVGNDEVTAGEGDGGIYVAPDSDKTGASGAWIRLFTDTIYAAWYGIVADGATDDGPAIQQSINGANLVGARYVQILEGTHLLGTQIALKEGVILRGVGESTVLAVGADIEVFSSTGSIATGESNTLASDAGDGETSVTLSAGKGGNFSTGEWALILSTAGGVNDASVQNRGEIVQVKSVSTDTLNLNGPLNFIYNTADSAEVQRITMLDDAGLADLRITNPDPTNYTKKLTEWGFCYRPTMSRVHVDGNRNTTFIFQGCVGARLSACSAFDLKSQTTTPAGFGYFVAEAGPNVGLSMSDCRCERARHAYTTLEGKEVAGVTVTNGEPMSSSIVNCTHMFPRAAGFDTHEEGVGITMTNCHVYSSEREGFQVRAVDVALNGCQVHGATAEGFQFAKSVRASAINCHAYRTNKGADPETSSDSTDTGAFQDAGEDTYLSGCHAFESGGHGFEFVDAGTALRPFYVNCRALRVSRASGAAGRGFYSRSTQDTTVILKNCVAYDNSSAVMSRGFDAANGTPTLWADGCYTENWKNAAYNGPWIVTGGLNGAFGGYGQPETITVSGGAIDINSQLSSVLILDGEGGAADDLVTINGGQEGATIRIFKGNAQITVKDGTGNITVEGGADFLLDNALDMVELIKRGSNWLALAHGV